MDSLLKPQVLTQIWGKTSRIKLKICQNFTQNKYYKTRKKAVDFHFLKENAGSITPALGKLPFAELQPYVVCGCCSRDYNLRSSSVNASPAGHGTQSMHLPACRPGVRCLACAAPRDHRFGQPNKHYVMPPFALCDTFFKAISVSQLFIFVSQQFAQLSSFYTLAVIISNWRVW